MAVWWPDRRKSHVENQTKTSVYLSEKCLKLFFLYLQDFIMLALCGILYKSRDCSSNIETNIHFPKGILSNIAKVIYICVRTCRIRSRLSSNAGLLRDKSHGRTTRINVGHERCLKAERSFPFLIIWSVQNGITII